MRSASTERKTCHCSQAQFESRGKEDEETQEYISERIHAKENAERKSEIETTIPIEEEAKEEEEEAASSHSSTLKRFFLNVKFSH